MESLEVLSSIRNLKHFSFSVSHSVASIVKQMKQVYQVYTPKFLYLFYVKVLILLGETKILMNT
jgi:hypothetical protein